MRRWMRDSGIQTLFIGSGSPWENGYIESFNGKLRDECLNEHWFLSLDDAREKIESWSEDYNHRRPHSSTELGTQIRGTSGLCDL